MTLVLWNITLKITDMAYSHAIKATDNLHIYYKSYEIPGKTSPLWWGHKGICEEPH